MNVIDLRKVRAGREAAVRVRRFLVIQALTDKLLEEIDRLVDGPDRVEAVIWRSAQRLCERLCDEVQSNAPRRGESRDVSRGG